MIFMTAIDLKSSPAAIYPGEPPKGVKTDVTVTVDDADFVALAMGQLRPETVRI